MAQVQRLRDLPGSPVAALKYLSSSVTYRGSRGDLAEARRTYVEDPSLVHDEVRVIYGREKLYRSAKMGMWAYPGWRVDVSAALRGRSSLPTQNSLESALEKLDRKQELDDALAHGVLSKAGTSLKSYVSGISFITWLVIVWAFLLSGYISGDDIGDELSGTLLICALANSYVY